MIDYDKLREEHKKLSTELSSQDIYNDRERYQKIAKRYSFLDKLLNKIEAKESAVAEKKHLDSIINDIDEDEEVKELAKEELLTVEKKIKQFEDEIENTFLGENSTPDKDVIIEIRAAAGGEEAALFASVLFKMYSKYAEIKGWHLEVLNSHLTEIGGIKEVVFSLKGKGCYSHLKFESGVHRVQRVPVTESGGRIHTSTATVAVLVEPKNVELEIDPSELRIDTFRASGHGGQHVNKTDSAVRITHLPTGLAVSCQAERSQIKNRAKAMRMLKARLLDRMQRQENNKVSKERRVQVGSGDRSEKIRTYNFPERRVTEHRINLTLYKLESILEGDLDGIVTALIKEEKKKIYEAEELGRDE